VTPPLFAPFALPRLDNDSAPDVTAWAPPLVHTVGALAAAQGAQGLVLAGWTPGWPDYTAAQWSEIAGLPVTLSDDPVAVAGNAAVMWLGAPGRGAAYLAALRERQPGVEFWLGPAGGDPVFADQAETRERVYWVVWVDDGYNSWAAAHSPSTPSAYLVYRTTQEALRRIDGRGDAILPPPTWRVQAYTFGPGGEPSPHAPAP
jgi:branched-chain amino acid transport system substrate-binding protein